LTFRDSLPTSHTRLYRSGELPDGQEPNWENRFWKGTSLPYSFCPPIDSTGVSRRRICPCLEPGQRGVAAVLATAFSNHILRQANGTIGSRRGIFAARRRQQGFRGHTILLEELREESQQKAVAIKELRPAQFSARQQPEIRFGLQATPDRNRMKAQQQVCHQQIVCANGRKRGKTNRHHVLHRPTRSLRVDSAVRPQKQPRDGPAGKSQVEKHGEPGAAEPQNEDRRRCQEKCEEEEREACGLQRSRAVGIPFQPLVEGF